MIYKLKPANSYPDDVHLKIIYALASKGISFSYTGLVRSIMDIARKFYLKIGINKAKLLAKYYYSEKDFIIKKDNGIYLLNERYIPIN